MTAIATLTHTILIALAPPPEAKAVALDFPYLSKGKLAQTLTFRDTQGGFAGFTGNTYQVNPDGSWTVTRVFNRRKFEPHAKGKLSEKQLKELAEVLKKNKVRLLPAKSGSRAQANPLLMTLTFGKTKSVVALRAGTSDPKSLPKGKAGDVGRRMLAVRAFLRKTMKPAKK